VQKFANLVDIETDSVLESIYFLANIGFDAAENERRQVFDISRAREP